jgi:hypothetical protein
MVTSGQKTRKAKELNSIGDIWAGFQQTGFEINPFNLNIKQGTIRPLNVKMTTMFEVLKNADRNYNKLLAYTNET